MPQMGPFDWNEYHTLAQELLRGPGEARFRSSISRAYYFVYHIAKQRLLDNQFVFPDRKDAHAQVWEKYSAFPHHECAKLAEIAKRLKEKREKADYDDLFPRVDKDAAEALKMAYDFSRRLSQLDTRYPRKV